MAKDSTSSYMTKKFLADALIKFMGTRPLNKISVKELVECCKLNRQTFYYHFEDIYALAEWMFRDLVATLINERDTHDTWQEGVLDVLQYIQKNKAMCLSAYKSVGRAHLREFLYSDIFELFRKPMMARDLKIAQRHLDFVAHFYTLAFAGVIENWLINGLKETPEELIYLLSVMVDTGIDNALSVFADNDTHSYNNTKAFQTN